MTQHLQGPVAYLTGEYPRATDTFIQREVAALRAHGLTVETHVSVALSLSVSLCRS